MGFCDVTLNVTLMLQCNISVTSVLACVTAAHARNCVLLSRCAVALSARRQVLFASGGPGVRGSREEAIGGVSAVI